MHLRNAVPTDAEQIYEVHDSNGESGEWADISECREQIEWMLQKDAASIVAEVDRKIVGEMKVWWGEDVPEFGWSLDISTLYVHRDYQRRGIGKALIHRAIEISRKHGCECICVWPDEDSVGFYRKQGFESGLNLREFLVDPSDISSYDDSEAKQVYLSELDSPVGHYLLTQRILHPSQRWHDLVKQEATASIQMDAEHRGSPILSYLIFPSEKDIPTLAIYRLFYWKNDPKKAELYLWSPHQIDIVLPLCLVQADRIGLEAVSILAYGKVAERVSILCGNPGSGKAQVLVRRIR